MRLSTAYIPTQKEMPADAVIPSHQYMLRAGMIRLLVSGVYCYLPLGWRIMRKAMDVIREEMDRIGGQELQLPVLNPVEIWDETGRNTDFGDEIFRLQDRKGRTLILAPTHEEVICDLARKYIQSYKDMPQIWYQIQTKFRDEPRPRSGVMRTRQFIMKDSYTLDCDQPGLDAGYALHDKAYRAIFTRCGLRFHVVGASSGLMGGSGSQEFMVESQYGEDTLVLCTVCGKVDNLEIAKSIPEPVHDPISELQRVHTPDKRTIDQVSVFLEKKPNQMMKSLLYVAKDPILVLIRGDHEVNDSKLLSVMGPVRPAHPDEIPEICGADAGFVGPIGMKKKIRVIADFALKGQHNLTTGANQNDTHISGVELDRDIPGLEFMDLRSILPNEKCTVCQGSLRVMQAVELGHIFKLGTKYSKSMKASYLDNAGMEKAIFMGSYGIGVERILAAYIEQNYDPDKGMFWNKILAPYLVHIIPVQADKEEIVSLAEEIYKAFQDAGIDAILDDRQSSAGFKFKDADLLGMPLQIIVGSKWLKESLIEIKNKSNDQKVYCSKQDLLKTVRSILDSIQ